MAKTVEKQKLVVIDIKGSIAELGGISGPILNPTWIGMTKLIRMVNRYRKIYEVNPKNKNERILLSVKNVRKENFPEPNDGEAPIIPEKKVEETPKKEKKGKKEDKVEVVEETKTEPAKEEKNDGPVIITSDFAKI